MQKENVRSLDMLLVEDNQDDILLTELAIKKLKTNINIKILNNGKQALGYLSDLVKNKNKLPDLILLDINMPIINGHEVLKEIKSNSFTQDIKVVVFTSSDCISDKEDCYKNNANLYLKKPNNLNDFQLAINKVFQETLY